MIQSRRGILKLLAASPAGAHILGQQLTATAGGGALAVASNLGYPGNLPSTTQPERFYDFASWFIKHGRRQLWQEAKPTYLDPDIMSMHLPINTKHRMQRLRNYDQLIEQRKLSFGNAFKTQGWIEWWT